MPAINKRKKRPTTHPVPQQRDGETGGRNLDQDMRSVGIVVAGVETIDRFVKTSRFILATALLQLAWYVAPAGSELERYLKALLEGWSGD